MNKNKKNRKNRRSIKNKKSTKKLPMRFNNRLNKEEVKATNRGNKYSSKTTFSTRTRTVSNTNSKIKRKKNKLKTTIFKKLMSKNSSNISTTSTTTMKAQVIASRLKKMTS